MGFQEILARRLITVVLVFGVVVGLGWVGRLEPGAVGCFAWQRAVMEELQSQRGNARPDELVLEDIEATVGGSRPHDCSPIIGPKQR